MDRAIWRATVHGVAKSWTKQQQQQQQHCISFRYTTHNDLMFIYIARLGASLKAQLVKNPPAIRETLVQLLGWEDPLEKG